MENDDLTLTIKEIGRRRRLSKSHASRPNKASTAAPALHETVRRSIARKFEIEDKHGPVRIYRPKGKP